MFSMTAPVSATHRMSAVFSLLRSSVYVFGLFATHQPPFTKQAENMAMLFYVEYYTLNRDDLYIKKTKL